MTTTVLPEAPIIELKKMTTKRLLCDLDGCIVTYDFTALVKNFFGVELSPKDIYAYDLADVLGVSPKEIDKMFKEQVYGKPNFIEGSLDTLNEWKTKGYEIIIFSNRVKYMGYEGLARWLIKYQIPFNGLDGGTDTYDVHIDDSASKLMATDSKLKLLYSQSWNERCLNITGSLQRVSSWEEIRETVW